MWCAGTSRRLPRFFVQAEPPPFTSREVVVDAHANRSAHAREAVHHEADEGAIAQADEVGCVNRVEQLARLFSRQKPASCRVSPCNGVREPSSPGSGQDLADDEPVEQRADCGEMLFHGGRRSGPAEIVDVARHDCWLDALETDAQVLEPI